MPDLSTTTDILPKPVDDLAVALGDISNLPRKEDIPAEFWRNGNPWHDLAHRWFFGQLKAVPPIKPHLDRRAVLRAIRSCLCSWDPSHEHKSAGVGYLLSLWCEPSAVDTPHGRAADATEATRKSGRHVGKGRKRKRNQKR